MANGAGHSMPGRRRDRRRRRRVRQRAGDERERRQRHRPARQHDVRRHDPRGRVQRRRDRARARSTTSSRAPLGDPCDGASARTTTAPRRTASSGWRRARSPTAGACSATTTPRSGGPAGSRRASAAASSRSRSATWDDANIIWGGGGAAQLPHDGRVPADHRRRDDDARVRALARPAPRRPRRRPVQAQLPERHELPVPDARARATTGRWTTRAGRCRRWTRTRLVESAGVAAGTDVLTRSRVGRALGAHGGTTGAAPPAAATCINALHERRDRLGRHGRPSAASRC